MGWGICFALDESGRVYCADGCKWRATKADYQNYYVWPSAQQAVLDYFESRDVHSELDMIRDECPGTASALAEACDEHIGRALSEYDELSDKEKTELHEEELKRLEEELVVAERGRSAAYAAYLEARKAFKAYTPPTKNVKTRIQEIELALYPLNLELRMEKAAHEYDNFKSKCFKLKKNIKLEKMFHL